MREILFRGRTTDCGWKIGTFISTYLEKMLCTDGEARIIPNLAGPPHCGIVTDFGEIFVVERETVGQYTGLKDRNGQKIFEGDIVEGEDFNEEAGYGVIRFSGGAFIVESLFSEGTFYTNYYADRLTIIGNAYDNPELLKEEK